MLHQSRTVPEYQYHLKDHLGNVRLTFTTKSDLEESFATLETVHAFDEQGQFLHYDEAIKIDYDLFDHTYDGTTGDTYYSTRLIGGNTNAIYGLAKSLSVMPGDTIKMEVYAKYLDPNSQNWSPALMSFMTAIAGGTAPSGTVVDGGSPGSTGGQGFPYADWFDRSSEDNTSPKAYLNFIVFDRNFDPIIPESGYRRITVNSREYGNNAAHDLLQREPLVIKEPGYVYIYLSNENETPVEVFFDDFKVEHIKSPVVQMDDYYPFGLTFNSYSRERTIPNPYLYNGKEMVNALELGWLDYGARAYMADIARWMTLDPLTELMSRHSPYGYAYNNSERFIDPDGMMPGETVGADGLTDSQWLISSRPGNGFFDLQRSFRRQNVAKEYENLRKEASVEIGELVEVESGEAQQGGFQNDPLKKHMDQAVTLDQWVQEYKGSSYFEIITEAGWKDGQPLGPKIRYVVNPTDGNVMDMRHVTVVGYGYGDPFGDIIEHLQNMRASTRPSAFDPQDYYSNDIGDSFANYTVFTPDQWLRENWAIAFRKFLNK